VLPVCCDYILKKSAGWQIALLVLPRIQTHEGKMTYVGKGEQMLDYWFRENGVYLGRGQDRAAER
jgi:hypothetical protein